MRSTERGSIVETREREIEGERERMRGIPGHLSLAHPHISSSGTIFINASLGHSDHA